MTKLSQRGLRKETNNYSLRYQYKQKALCKDRRIFGAGSEAVADLGFRAYDYAAH
jgi:hypothetical protein